MGWNHQPEIGEFSMKGTSLCEKSLALPGMIRKVNENPPWWASLLLKAPPNAKFGGSTSLTETGRTYCWLGGSAPSNVFFMFHPGFL